MKLLLLLSAACGAARLGRPLSDINTRGVLRVGSTGDYKPFSYRSGNDFIGLDIELAGELAQAMGVKLVVVPTNWPTLMSDFRAGKFDIALSGVSVTAERQQQAISRSATCAMARPRSRAAATRRASRRWSKSTSRTCA
jgi:ABC-type amino acid transport substrate-binding protein